MPNYKIIAKNEKGVQLETTVEAPSILVVIYSLTNMLSLLEETTNLEISQIKP